MNRTARIPREESPERAHMEMLSDRLLQIAQARAAARGEFWPEFTAEEEPVHYLDDAWGLVDDPDCGFRLLVDTWYCPKIAAQQLELMGLPRIAEIYRFVHAMMPPERGQLGWRAEQRLSPLQLELLDLLTERVRRAEPEIVVALTAYLEKLPSLRDGP
jgi:hypothetical protein